jgi:septal ring factor EnvC (AmiA/AmiB activator)
MPQQTSGGIDVSKEEEKYLRSAFRRFALPYLLGFALVAWATTTLLSKHAPAGSGADLSSLREKVASLEQSVAVLERRVEKVGSEIERMGALESRKPADSRAASEDTAQLESTLRDATRRIAELEKRESGGAPAEERIDALFARMQRIEAIQRSSSPAPAAPAASSPAP